jgi:hypothetical protein
MGPRRRINRSSAVSVDIEGKRVSLALDCYEFRFIVQPMSSSASNPRTSLPRSMTAIGVFLLFGAVMASLAGTTLVWHGTSLDRIWALNRRAYEQLAPFGKAVGIPFLLLGVTLAIAGIGWFNYRPWGWRLAVAIVATQVLGNLVNAFTGDVVEGGIGFMIAGALLVYLLRPAVRNAFTTGN